MAVFCRNCKFIRTGYIGEGLCAASPIRNAYDYETLYELTSDKNYRGDCEDYAPNLRTKIVQVLNKLLDK